MNQVATTADQENAVVSRSATLLEKIVAASANPEVDANKMEQMANLALRLQQSEHEQLFAKDFAAAVLEMPRISKRNTIVIPANRQKGTPEREQGKFASWENIDAVVRPILARHHLVLTFKVGTANDGATSVTPILTHSITGYREVGDSMRVPPDTSGSKNAAQAVGSSTAYGKRYAACAMLNIVTEAEDRDGTSYPLASDELNDRQIRLVEEARASHKDGNFQPWWGRQLPSDRQWLILKGIYAELTGAPQIAGPRTLPADENGQGPTPEPEPTPRQDATNERKEPTEHSQMVDRYIRKIEQCDNTDSVLAITEDQGTLKWLRKLKEQDPQEHDRATVAASRHFSTLLAREETGDGGQGSLLDE